MARGKRYQPDQAVNLLRRIEAAVANGRSLDEACRDVGIVAPTYHRWYKQYAGLQADQAHRLKKLEQENAKLRRLVSDLSLEKLMLKQIASGIF